MGKKVRHLEFYGFPDQNVFTSAIGNVDLTEINKINKEQDEEISEISSTTNDKADISLLNELSANTNAFIEAQSNINASFVNSISGNTVRISALEEYDEEITSIVNDAITNIESIHDDIEVLSGAVDEVNEYVDNVSGITDELSGAIDTVKETLEEKLDKAEAEEIYAKKEDVYTKDVCDALILEEEEKISGLTEDINVLSGAIDNLQEEIDNLPQIDTDKFALKTDLAYLSGSFLSYSAVTDEAINSMDDDIYSINNNISTIQRDIESINTELANKVNNRTFTAFTSDVEDMFNEVNDKKADKTDVQEVDDKVSALRNDLNQEIQDREDGDALLDTKIASAEEKAESAITFVAQIGDITSGIEERIGQEIQDRIDGDNAIIGSSSDYMNDDTVWGAKKYAEHEKIAAVQESKIYTDDKFNGVETYINNELDEMNADLAKKANKTYVDETVNDKVGEVSDELTNALTFEASERSTTDGYLQSQINDLNDAVYSGMSAEMAHMSNRLNVITTYTGDTVDNYTDSGNGVLDVLHREFHELQAVVEELRRRIENNN